MILFELVGNEKHPVYQDMEISNGARQYDFLRSIVQAAIDVGRPFLSSQVVKSLNYHAIACLHTNAGEYRPCQVVVGDHTPPAHFRVDALMDDFINQVNRNWESTDPVVLSAYVLWRMNYIHPFINGNGRSARAACYFVLCVTNGGWLPGKTILPELIKRERAAYVNALTKVDESFHAGNFSLEPLHQLLVQLISEQIGSVSTSEEPHPEEPK